MMRQDRFTQQAQEVLAASQEIVREQRHSQWDVEHVLLALLQHKDGLAGRILDAMQVDVRALTQRVADTLGAGAEAGVRRRAGVHDAAHRQDARDRERRGGPPQGRVRRRRAPADRDRRRARRRVGADPARSSTSTRRASTSALQEVRGSARVDSPTAENRYGALEKYSIDLTQAAREGKLDPVIGRDQEIKRVMQILNRRTKNNPVIIGEAGVGKTAVVEGLASKIVGRRRAGEHQGQAAARARHGRDGRRREVPRRVRRAPEVRDGRDPPRRGRGDHLHRRAAPGRRRRRGRRRDRRQHDDEAGAVARRAARHRRDDARRVPQVHREGPGTRAALLAGVPRRADARRDDRDPARPARRGTRRTTR